MVKKLLVILLILNTSFTYAATIKTDVLVIGNGAGAAAAAIQSARSKLKTILIVNGGWLDSKEQKAIIFDQFYIRTVNKNNDPKNTQQDFFYTRTDTTSRLPHDEFVATIATDLKKRADTLKYLTIKLHTTYTDIVKDGTGWKVTIIVDGTKNTIKTKVLIDATEKGELVVKVGGQFPPGINDKGTPYLYRTSIATGTSYNETAAIPLGNYPYYPAFYIPLSAVVVTHVSNLFIVDKALIVNDNYHLPAEVSLGEGVGAAAAYCAFFKTTTKNLKVRAVQIELLDFKSSLLPFADVDQTDTYYRSIQQIGATGTLKGEQQEKDGKPQFVFLPDKIVTTEEIKPVLTEIYSRAFLWLNKAKPAKEFTVGNLLSLISEIDLSEPNDFILTTQKAWKTEYKFTNDFDLNAPVTRRQFAILANKYLNPFARTVDMGGRIVN